jgi:flagellar basal body-associated protein FliL
MVMEMLMVNIAETKGTRVLRITPHLVLSEEGAAAKLTPMKAMLIDKIAGVASARTIDELDGAKGRELLKDDIKKGLNALIEHKMAGSVVDVYFSEYLIQ